MINNRPRPILKGNKILLGDYKILSDIDQFIGFVSELFDCEYHGNVLV